MPFTRTSASADTCVLSDFIAAGRPDLLWRLFPDGIWIDPGAAIEIQVQFGPSILANLRAQGCEPLIERGFEPGDYIEMAEIKTRRPALRHPDIACVVLARMHGATCLSSDGAVRKTCQERGILMAGQVGCLTEAIDRRLLKRTQAQDLLRTFLANGLYLPTSVVAGFLAMPKAV